PGIPGSGPGVASTPVRSRVVVLAGRDRLADSLVQALRSSPGVEGCERGPRQATGVEAAALSGFDTLVYSALPADAATIGPDINDARAVSERLASLPLKHVVVLSSAAIYSPNHQNVGLLDEDTFIPEGRSDIADGWREVERLTANIGHRSGGEAPVLT